jgi:AcrR family transcriptional regulator
VPAGRPRSFNTEKALDQALKVFWRRGYEGASLPELTKAMGINRPSLYAAFGNKESLFRKVLDRYAEGPAGRLREALQEPKLRAAVERFLQEGIRLLTRPGNPRGCLMVQSALACSEAAQSVRRACASRRLVAEALLRRRFERAITDGDLPADSDAADLARYVATITNGMSVQAAGGAKRGELQRVAELALRTIFSDH